MKLFLCGLATLKKDVAAGGVCRIGGCMNTDHAGSEIERPLMELAERSTGLSDWGEHQGFRIGLRVLLQSLDDLELPEQVRQTLLTMWQGNLEKRLRLLDHRKKNPAIAAEHIGNPLAVIGLPRTGTTVLVDILALDPNARAPLSWETTLPWPPPTREGWSVDPRIEVAREAMHQMELANPEMAAQHTSGPLLPQECHAFLTMEFWSPNFWAQMSLPRYERWLTHSHPDQPYKFHRMMLQHMQHHGPTGRWVLKSPGHQFDIPALLQEYPGAMLVHTHRDPVKITASNCSLVAAVRRIPRHDPARHAVGRSNVDLWSQAIERGMAARLDPAVDARTYDMSNSELNADPIGAVRRLYKHFDLPFTDEYESRLQHWVDNPTQPPAGKKYSLEEHGLTEDDVKNAYANYRSRFADYLD